MGSVRKAEPEGQGLLRVLQVFNVFGRAENREGRPPAFSGPSAMCRLGCVGKSGGERGPQVGTGKLFISPALPVW